MDEGTPLTVTRFSSLFFSTFYLHFLMSDSTETYSDSDTLSCLYSSSETDHLSQEPIWDEYNRILEQEDWMENEGSEISLPKAKRTRRISSWSEILPSTTTDVPETSLRGETRTQVETG